MTFKIKEIELKIMLRTSFILYNHFHSQLGGPVLIISKQNDSFVRHMYPKMFQVVLLGCTNNNCDIEAKKSVANITLVDDDDNLWRMYGQTLHNEDDESLEELNEISDDLKRNLTTTEIDLVAKTIESVLVKQYHLVINENLSKANRTLIEKRREMLMNMLCKFMSPKRRDLTGNLMFFQLLEDVLFLDVTDATTSLSYLHSSTLTYKKYECSYSSFNYACGRVNSSSLHEISFEGEFYQMNFTTRFDRRFRTLNTFSSSLFQLCLIEVLSTNFLGDNLKKNLLENKALSLR